MGLSSKPEYVVLFGKLITVTDFFGTDLMWVGASNDGLEYLGLMKSKIWCYL